MVNISANCSPLRQSFGRDHSDRFKHRENDKTELLDGITSAANTLKDDNASEEKKADEIRKLSGVITNNMDSSSPFKVIVAAVGVGGAGFLLGRKMVGKKVLDLIDKNTKIVDKLTNKVHKGVEDLKTIKPNEDKSIHGMISRNAKSFVEKFENFAKKGFKPEELRELEKDKAKLAFALAKNGVKNSIKSVGGAIGAITGASEVARDKDKNGKSDFLEKTSELSTIGRIAKTIDTVDAATSLMQ